MSSSRSLPRLVLLGAGLGIKNLLPKLADVRSKVSLTVIDAKPFWENTTGAVRSVLDEAFWAKSVKLHTQYLGKEATVVVGVASELTTDKHVVVQTASGEQRVPYDYLVIATGTAYGPLTGGVFKTAGLSLDERKQQIALSAVRVREAKSVLIVGGGSVGCEMAGEISARYPTKKVTLVHGHARLLPRAPVKTHNTLMAQFKTRGVRVLLGDRIVREQDEKAGAGAEVKESKSADGPVFHSEEKQSEGKQQGEAKSNEKLTLVEYKTAKGETIEADVVFWCTGVTPNSGFMKRNFNSLLTDHGQIKVKATFQVDGEGLENVFAFGDVAATRDAMLAYNTLAHADAVAKNIVSLLAGKAPAAVYKLGTGFEPMIVMGPQQGVLTLPFKCCGCCDIVLVGPRYSAMKLPYMQATPPDAKD